MERIVMSGCGGAGKSTLARQVGQCLGLPVVHLDKLYWQENWTPLSKEAFDVVHAAALEEPRWIIDGNFSRTMQRRLERCDTVIYLDYPRWQCMLGVCKRILTTYGRTRPDMGPGCNERFDWEFIKWVWNFNRNNRQRIYALLAEATHAKVMILKSRKEGKRFLEDMNNPPV